MVNLWSTYCIQNPFKLIVPLAFLFLLLVDPLKVFSQDSIAVKTIAPEERDALVALYTTAGGPQWTKKSGWMGRPGTECQWYGVTCGYPAHITTPTLSIVSLDLANNNLVGTIPPELGRLKSLDWLFILDNHLAGTLPEALIQRWLAGPLHVAAEAHLLTSITKIDYESNASSLLCARHRIVLAADQTAVVYTTRCRNATRDDRTTYCEVKEGQVGWTEFGKLAWTIEKAGFFTLQSEYRRGVTHGTFEKTRVIKAGKAVEVNNYASAAPLELWSTQRAIEGVAANMEFRKIIRRATCPRW